MVAPEFNDTIPLLMVRPFVEVSVIVDASVPLVYDICKSSSVPNLMILSSTISMWLLAIKSPVKVSVCCATTVLANVADALNVEAALTVTLSDAPSPRVVSPLI